jgi:hypothetical protein
VYNGSMMILWSTCVNSLVEITSRPIPALTFSVHLNLQTRRELGEHVTHLPFASSFPIICYSGYTLSIACVPFLSGPALARIWPELRMDMRPTAIRCSSARRVRKHADRSPKKGNICDGAILILHVKGLRTSHLLFV